jgi:hypothetical protein
MTTQIHPQPNVLYGLTHDAETGAEIIRVPRTVKVGIGRPSGPDIHVYINMAGKWSVEIGVDDENRKRQAQITRFEKREEAFAFYRDNRKSVQALRYPMKLAYFTFSRPMGDGTLEPDWDAIERHGPLPTEIDIVFMDNSPLRAAYEMWSATGIQCRGDGINAERVLAMANSAEQSAAAEEAKAVGQKFFPILGGCCLRGCHHAQPTQERGREVAPVCKPHASLSFQLINDIRLGAQARFDTTSAKSIAQLHSSLLVLRSFTGGSTPERGFVAGIPLRLSLRPWKTNYQGKSGKAYAVSIEVRAESIEALRRKIIAAGMDFRQALELPAPAKQLPAQRTKESLPEESEYPETYAAALVAEFHPEQQGQEQELDEPPTEGGEPDTEGGPAEPAGESAKVAEATSRATADLKGKLASRKRTAAPAPPPVEQPKPAAPANEPPVEDLF